jgi:hypothetical protein
LADTDGTFLKKFFDFSLGITSAEEITGSYSCAEPDIWVRVRMGI